MAESSRTDSGAAAGPLGVDRIRPKRWLALYVAYLACLVALTALLPARFRIPGIGVIYLSLATTFIPLNTSIGVMFMASGEAMPGMVESVTRWFGATESLPVLLERLFGATREPYPLYLTALLASLATVTANLADYHALAWLMRLGRVRRLARTRFYERIAAWFNQAPFLIVLMINAFAIPFAADRLLAVPRGYSRPRYALAVFLGRYPRYYLTALAADLLKLNWWQIILVCGGIALAGIVIGRVRRAFSKKPPAPSTVDASEEAAVCSSEPGR